jgi:hypothetical protein
MFVLSLTTLLVADVCPLSDYSSNNGQMSATKKVIRERTNICYQMSSQRKDKHLLPKEMSDKGQTSATKRVVRTNIFYQKSSQKKDKRLLPDYSLGSRCLSFVWLLFGNRCLSFVWLLFFVAEVCPLSDYSLVTDVCPLSDYSFL